MSPPSKGHLRGFIVLLLTVIVSLAGCASGTTNSDNKITSDASTGSITGIVVASSSISFKASRIAFQETLTGTTAVPGAVCTIEGTDKNAATDENGLFTITDVAPGSYMLICRKTASDVFGNITEATRSFVFDQKPVLSVTDPLDGTVARPQLHISASCTDDDPAGCASITVKADEAIVATGQSSIDERNSRNLLRTGYLPLPAKKATRQSLRS
jgi:hypothetical protein